MISMILLLIAVLVINILPNAYNILAISAIVVGINVRFPTFFNKRYFFYILFLILGVLTFIFYDSEYLYLLSRGLVGYGFIVVVMFVGVLPNKWGLTRTIKKHRGTLSIIGFLAITPHALLHIFGMFGGIDLFGIASYVIMVPLTFISFKVIKKEIAPKDWLNIQKAAYGIYGLLFVHLLLVATWENKIVYAVLLTLYINNKLLKEIRR